MALQPNHKIGGSGQQPDPTLLGAAGLQDPTLLLILEVFWAWLGSHTQHYWVQQPRQTQQLLAEQAMPLPTILDKKTQQRNAPRGSIVLSTQSMTIVSSTVQCVCVYSHTPPLAIFATLCGTGNHAITHLQSKVLLVKSKSTVQSTVKILIVYSNSHYSVK